MGQSRSTVLQSPVDTESTTTNSYPPQSSHIPNSNTNNTVTRDMDSQPYTFSGGGDGGGGDGGGGDGGGGGGSGGGGGGGGGGESGEIGEGGTNVGGEGVGGGGGSGGEEVGGGGGTDEGDADLLLVAAYRDGFAKTIDSVQSGEGAGTGDVIEEAELNNLLSAISNVLLKYPSNSKAVLDACQALIACKTVLPTQPTTTINDIHSHAFATFPQLNFVDNMELIDSALNVVILLWTRYPQHLPPTCNVLELSIVVNAALDWDVHKDRLGAIQVGKDIVGFLMRLLSDEQIKELELNGVGEKLRSLIGYYDLMTAETLQQIVVGVGMLAEVKLDVPPSVDETFHTSLLFAALKFPSHAKLQQLIWRLLSVFVRQDKSFANQLLSCGILSTIVTIMKMEEYHLLPLVRFLTVSCHQLPNPFMIQCTESTELLSQLLLIVHPESTSGLENITNTCDFLAFLCSKLPPGHVGALVDLGVVSCLEDCARKWPEACLLPACLAIEGLSLMHPADRLNEVSRKKKEQFFSLSHHLFVKDMLSNSVVYVNATLVELIYITFQKLLRVCSPAALQSMCDKEFVEFFVVAFVRDTVSFPNQANRIAFTAHYFVFQMKHKECFEQLKENKFHESVVDLIASSSSYDLTVTSMGLVASLMGKYHDHLKTLKMFLETSLPDILVEKCVVYGHRQKSQFGDDFSRVLLNLTADKEMSLELYNQGFMTGLISLMGSNYISVIQRSIIHAVGNISLGGQNIKQELYDKEFYEVLLSTLRRELEQGDVWLLSACCRVLHILASGDWAKRKFVERGCVEVLLRLLETRKDNPEISWRPLGLLSSIGFMAVSNRRYVLTPEVIEAVANILKEGKNGKVISYTVLIFLASGELDEGAVSLRELRIEDHLKTAMDNVEFKAQGPELVRWGKHVLEKQFVYTVLVPPDMVNGANLEMLSSTSSPVDWPPRPLHLNSTITTASPSSSHQLLPLEESYFKPQYPIAPELGESAKQQLRDLGLDPDKPLFRVGRVYGSTHGFCSNCDKDGSSAELVIRPHSLTPHQYQNLIDTGWYRRGGVKMFRLRCNHNVLCCDWETRVNVMQFNHRTHKSYVKVLKRMPEKRLTVETIPTHFNREAFDLYNDYHVKKHDKPWKSEFSYCEHIVNSPLQPQTVDGIEYGTFHQLYRLDGKLVAIGIIDVVPKGIVSIYMWYNVAKDVSKYSFGVYSALKEIEMVKQFNGRNNNMCNYYLQGWNALNKKLSYKANYSPEDFYCPCIVEDWVESLDGVTHSQQKRIQEKIQGKKTAKEEEGEKRSKEGASNANDSEVKVDSTTIDSDSNSDSKKKSSESQPAPSTASSMCNSHGINQEDEEGKGREEEEKEKEEEESGGKKSDGGVKGSGEKGGGGEKRGEASGRNEGAEKTVDSVIKTCNALIGPAEAYPHDLARYTARTGRTKVDIDEIVVCLNHTEYTRLREVFSRYRIPEPQRDQIEKCYSELIVALSPELISQLVVDLKVLRTREKEDLLQRTLHESSV